MDNYNAVDLAARKGVGSLWPVMTLHDGQLLQAKDSRPRPQTPTYFSSHLQLVRAGNHRAIGDHRRRGASSMHALLLTVLAIAGGDGVVPTNAGAMPDYG